MIFLLNFVHFEAIFADSETDLLILKQHNGKASQVNKKNKGQGDCSDLC